MLSIVWYLAISVGFALIVSSCSSASTDVAIPDQSKPPIAELPSPTGRPIQLDDQGQALHATLQEARILWAEGDRSDYAYVYNRECDCDQPEPFGPNRVFVVDVVTHFGYRESLDGFTVLGLFDRIEVAILDAHPIDVTYDSDNGFPTLIRLGIDNETDEADFDLETRSLMSFVELRSAHADAAKRWSDSSISDYDLAYEVRCSCEDTGATVAVRNGDVVEKTFAKPDSPIGLEPVTVDSLFAEVEAAIDDKAYTIAVRYHPDLGYPISVEVDRDDRSGDERLTTITSLEPLDL